MSVHDSGAAKSQSKATGARMTRVSVPDLVARKGKDKIVCLTAYTTPMARALDPHVDLLLVGDSLGMVIYGFESTLPRHPRHDGRCTAPRCARGSEHACLVVDMPFGSYQEVAEQAFRSAARLMKETGCSAVKMEGGREHGADRRVPRQARHPGDGPCRADAAIGQHPRRLSRARPRQRRGRRRRWPMRSRSPKPAPSPSWSKAWWSRWRSAITARVPVPTIGIGASADCDGQVLVAEDMLGLFGAFKPRFVKRYAELADEIAAAAAHYAADVRTGSFPGPDNVFGSLKKSS